MNIYTTEEIIPVAGGGTYTVTIHDGVQTVVVRPAAAITLSADVNITATGTPIKNQYIKFLYAGTITSNTSSGWTVNIFGKSLTDAQALYEAEITALYNGSAWEVKVFPSREGQKNLNGAELVDDSIPTDALADNAVTNDKLNSITRGYVKVGGASNAPTDLDASGDAKILIGDGTDLNSVTVTGDVTISNTGVTTIGSGVVDEAMLSFTLSSYLETTVTLTSAQVLTLNSDPIQLIAAPGANKLIQLIRGTVFLDYDSAAYAAGGDVICNYDASGGNAIATVSQATVQGAVDTIETFAMNTPILTTAINAPVYIENLTAAFTTGDSPLKVNLVYNIIDFS